MTKNKPTKQHFIPQMILKNFADDNNLLRYFDKSIGKIDERTPKGMFKEYYRYTEYLNGGKWGDWSPDDKLQTSENDAEPIFRIILRAVTIGSVPALSPENQAICKRFYIYMVLRNPSRATEMLHEMGVDDAKSRAICNFLQRAGMTPPSQEDLENDQGLKDFVEKLEHNIQARHGAGVPSQLDQEVEDLISNLRISIGVARDQTARFFIGDCGVTRHEEDENRAFGWLPIAPNVAISVRPDSGKVHFLDMDVDQVQAVNEATWSQSNIVAAKCVADLDPFIQKESALVD